MKTLARGAVIVIFSLLIVRELILLTRPAGELRGETRVLTVHGTLENVTTKGDRIDLELRNADASYRINGSYIVGKLGLMLAKGSHAPITLRVYLDGARFHDQRPEYWVESFSYAGRTNGKYQVPERGWSADASASMAGLLRGTALTEAGLYDEAIREFDAALTAGELEDKPLILAYRLRAAAREVLAYPPGSSINDHDDKLLLDAYTDYRQLAELESDTRFGLTGQVRTLDSLGAYRESLALEDQILLRWPKNFFRVAIMRSTTYRHMGKHTAALTVLDELEKEHGPQNNMMFHYHRGWNLSILRRYPGAATEFTAGLRYQPDYAWAYRRRACAFAQIGDLKQALADAHRALELWTAQAAAQPATVSTDADRRELERTVEELDAMAQSNAPEVGDDVCTRLDDDPRLAREPSPLLRQLKLN